MHSPQSTPILSPSSSTSSSSSSSSSSSAAPTDPDSNGNASCSSADPLLGQEAPRQAAPLLASTGGSIRLSSILHSGTALLVKEAASLRLLTANGSMPRFKRPILFLLLVLITNLTLYLLFRPFPQLESFVQDTNKRIHTGVSAIRTNLNPAGARELDGDETYLEYLGLLGRYEPQLSGGFKLARDTGSLGFVVASSVSAGDFVYAFDLLDSVRMHLNDTLLVLLDTGLHMSDLNRLKKRCNATSRCRIESFDFDKFPSHVRRVATSAYKPLGIQTLLRDYGGLIWCDLKQPPYYFVADSEDIQPTLAAARRVGIQAWTIPPPASALTHPQTFNYLKADPREFYFLHMVASAHLVLYYTEFLHQRVMLPWVKCALNSDCWQPLGAHQVGCDFNRPPYFKYSGCHFYDMSALNVVLGLAFNFNVSAYECRQKIFGYNSNDTSLENHFDIPGISFEDLRRRAGFVPPPFALHS